MFGNLAAVLLFAAVCGLQAQHHHDPFAGSGCTCETFCNYECSINASKPSTTTYYRMTPKGVMDMNNKNTGDPNGDTSFVLSRRTIELECRNDPDSFYCTGMTQFDGDDKNSTDLVIAFDIETDGQWGPYLYCNPRNVSNPLGEWGCTVSLSGGGGATPITPPAQCSADSFEVFDNLCWESSRWQPPIVLPNVQSLADCCTAASSKSAEAFEYVAANSTCAVYPYGASHTTHCIGGQLGYKEQGPPVCNCSRVHQTVGRENLTQTYPGYNSIHPAGGVWYSHPETGMCKDGQNLGDNNCTWKVVKVEKIIKASCMYEHLDDNVVNNNPTCFSQCAKPYNVTSDCYLQCYTQSTESMTHEQLVAPWGLAFASGDPTKGGCAAVTSMDD